MMSEASKLVDEEGFLIQDGNPLPVTSGAGSLLDKQISKISEEETLSSQILENKFDQVLEQLKIMNLHLAMMNDQTG